MLVALLSLLPILFALASAAPVDQDPSLEKSSPDVRGLVDLEPRQGGRNRGGRTRPTGTRAAATTATAATAASAVTPAVSEPVPAPAPASDTAASADPVGTPAAVGAEAPAAEAPTGSTGAAESTASGTTGGTTTGADDTTGTTNGTTTGTTGTDDTTGTSNSTSSGTDSGSAGTGSGPIGIGWDSEFNKADLTTYKAAGLQWWYNWQLQPSEGVESIVEFVPMVWGKANVPELAGALASWTDDIQYVLSFNEPDQPTAVGGAAMTEVESAGLHNQIVETLGGKYKISTPGISRGNFKWMDAWLAACETLGGCHYDFVAYHYYGRDAQDMIKDIKKLHEQYGKEVWMTEWDCHEFPLNTHSCTKEEAETFMKTAIEWFRGEGATIVTRWAWFGALEDMTNWHGTSNMDASRIANADGTVNEFGKQYLAM